MTSDLRHRGGVRIDRGRTTIRSAFDAGTARFTLSNAAGDYSPNNTGSPYTGDMNIGTPVRIQAEHDSTTYDLFRGHIARWPVLNAQNTDLTVDLFCTDNLPLINLEELVDEVYAEESTDTRIGNILDDVGWPAADRDLDAGVADAAAFIETFGVYIADNVSGTFTLTVSGETTGAIVWNAVRRYRRNRYRSPIRNRSGDGDRDRDQRRPVAHQHRHPVPTPHYDRRRPWLTLHHPPP